MKGIILNVVTGLLLAISLLSVVLLAGCGSRDRSAVVATVGSMKLTRDGLTVLAGVPAESLKTSDRMRVLQGWIDHALVEQEGKRRKLDHDPLVAMKLSAVRADLYLSKLLSEVKSSSPSDSMVAAYYTLHRSEFLRPVDTYLLELFWGEHQNVMESFRSTLERGDTSMVTAGDVLAEGRWLADAGELDPDFEHEISTLKPGEVTFPRKYEDGYRVARLVEPYPAGTVLNLSAVKDEILSRLLMEQSRARQDSLFITLRERYPVKLLVRDSL